jgi:hypothetical protein
VRKEFADVDFSQRILSQIGMKNSHPLSNYLIIFVISQSANQVSQVFIKQALQIAFNLLYI